MEDPRFGHQLPAFQLSVNRVSTPSKKGGEDWVLKNQMELCAEQVQDLVEFLNAQESLLKCISFHDDEDDRRNPAVKYISTIHVANSFFPHRVHPGLVAISR